MLPTLLGLPPKAEFEDVVRKVNQLVKELTNVLLNLDSLNVVSLTADHIDTGTIDAGLVTIRSILNAGAFIRIDGNGMTVNDGTKDVFTVNINGFVTLTGALFQTSAATYPKVTIDPTTTLFKAEQSSTSRIEVAASHSGSSPALLIYQGAGLKLQIQEVGGDTVLFATVSGDDLQLSSSKDLYLNGAKIRINASSDILINGTPGYTGTVDGSDTLIVTKGLITGKL